MTPVATIVPTPGLANQINHLATACNIGVGSNEGWSGLYHRLNVRYSGALQEYKVCCSRGRSL